MDLGIADSGRWNSANENFERMKLKEVSYENAVLGKWYSLNPSLQMADMVMFTATGTIYKPFEGNHLFIPALNPSSKAVDRCRDIGANKVYSL